MSGISEGVLITQLKELERHGVIVRHSYDEVPPRVDYRLTEAGHQLEQALRELDLWGRRHRARGQGARASAEERLGARA